MKQMKKKLALLLAIAMIFSLSIFSGSFALADEEDPDGVSDELLDAEPEEDDDAALEVEDGEEEDTEGEDAEEPDDVIPDVISGKTNEELAADLLYGLGLFRGYGDDEDGNPVYGLEDNSTRIQGLIMFLRFIGEEAAALAGDFECPFDDVEGEDYRAIAGYASANGYTQGVSATEFDPSATVSATQYLTFILRALGYADGVDFEWDKAWLLTDDLGITQGQFDEDSSTFLRGDLVVVSVITLMKAVNVNTGNTIFADLVELGIINEEQAEEATAAFSELAVILALPVSEINIFSFNDFHGTVNKAASGSNPGADRFVAVVQALMGRYDNSVILSGGDSYQGSPLSNIYYGEPVSEMLKLLGVEYSALGNHEYDWGDEYLSKFAEDGDITFLAANIFYEGTDDQPDYVEPYGIIEVDGLKIGIVGYTTTQTPTLVKAEYVAGLEFRAAGAWLAALISELREDEGCDLVIALSHAGVTVTNGGYTITGGEATTLADYDFDGIIGGHSHSWAADIVNGVPIVMGGYNGRGLGHLNVKVLADGTYKVTPIFYSQNDMNTDAILPALAGDHFADGASNLETSSDPSSYNKEMFDIIVWYEEDIGPFFAQVAGYYGEPITSRHEQAVWATQIVWDYIYRETGEEYVLFQNGGGFRDTSPYEREAEDEVTLGYLYTLMPFDNEIVLLDMKGSDLLYILNLVPDANGVPIGDADLNPTEGTIPPILGQGLGSSAYFAGAEQGEDGGWYLLSGEEITADGIYKVSCNDFMLTGGDRFPFPSYPDYQNVFGDAFEFEAVGNMRFMGVPLRNAMIEELEFRVAEALELAA